MDQYYDEGVNNPATYEFIEALNISGSGAQCPLTFEAGNTGKALDCSGEEKECASMDCRRVHIGWCEIRSGLLRVGINVKK